MKLRALIGCVAIAGAACGGGAGRAAPADGATPSGKHRERALVLVEGEDPSQNPGEGKDEKKPAAPGDGTTTHEIVQSVEQDEP